MNLPSSTDISTTKQKDPSKAIKKRNEEFRQRIEVCKQYRRKLIANWTVSIDYRRAKPFASQTDEDQIAVPLDWTLTKSKQASLFSQIPQVRVDHAPQSLKAPWTKTFEQCLNDNLIQSGIESAMNECLPDCINAAGIGIVMVSYEAITEPVDIPTSDPLAQDHSEQISVPRVVDKRYVIQRISPSDLLWHVPFTGSNFDNSPWVGRSGRVTWADAVQKFELKEEDRESVLGEDRTTMDKLTHDVEKDKLAADNMVGFDEIYFRENQYDSEAKSFNTIHHLVFVNGKDDPVIDEPWKGQQLKNNFLIGARKYPIRVLTLTYITDETIPPSDSAIARSQVNEINKSRTQMIRQRERSLPVRWFDVNRVDPVVQQSLMRGTWQAMIPVQGDGTRTIGEVARAVMPKENFSFDKLAKTDLNEIYGIGGAGIEADNVGPDKGSGPQAPQVREGMERAKVGSFFVSIAEVLGGLICLYEDPASLGEGFDPKMSAGLSFSILADSTVLLDANQKLERLNKFLNTYAKSGWVNIEPVLKEIASLSGLDPNSVVQAPQPKPPVEPNVSLRLTGTEDLYQPIALAMLLKSGQAPDAQLIEQAKQLIQSAVVPPNPQQQQQAQQGQQPPQAPPPNAPPPKPGNANPEWSVLQSLDKRAEGDHKPQ